jgi:hypothetical protein
MATRNEAVEVVMSPEVTARRQKATKAFLNKLVRLGAVAPPTSCGEETLCPDDSIRACTKPHGHEGWHDAGVR